jgi:hypothetical protein
MPNAVVQPASLAAHAASGQWNAFLRSLCGRQNQRQVKIPGYRVLTDLTGGFNRVILEYEAENLAEFESRIKEYMTDDKFREKMKGYTELWVTGSREILVVA